MSKTDLQEGHTHGGTEMAESQAGQAPGAGQTAIDPVCGMTVALRLDSRTDNFAGTDSHFCSDKCRTKFKADPWFYASGNMSKHGKVAEVAA